MHFHDFDSAVFLRDFWQQKPLLIRNPWREWRNPLEPDALAGLACESEIESRLITSSDVPATKKGGRWQVEHGPVPEQRFGKLDRQPWTLLVQAVDHHVPEVAALIDGFRFLPNWRIDDVMVSYASDGGGVGPHFDQYDVFLIQGMGRRRWQIGPMCDSSTPLLPHDDLRLLANMDVQQEWIVEPGDILYVPPRFAHNGVAIGDDCMTYSVGFRAPSRSELIAHWCDDVLARSIDEDRYTDPNFAPQDNAGEISANALARLHEMVSQTLLDREAFARWFGQYNSTPKYAETDWRPDTPLEIAELKEYCEQGGLLLRNPASRFSFVRNSADSVMLFVDGQCFDCDHKLVTLAEHMCDETQFSTCPALAGSAEALDLLVRLINQGSLALDYDDDDEVAKE
jgi:50S ribosomal protein L16 3-hydroxylase